MNNWIAEIQVSPHSTGRGVEQDQKEAGDRKQTIEFQALDFNDAVRLATIFALGIERNPMVWQAKIIKLERRS